ncbi:MAG: hypothetical protein I8H75_04970 [Myxococcaceae bacterium]|nr:hypothetical protein [Myxococcaceae bacterium]MBH2006677.1 hypothetical protein [Myxococcaceae bacterium]
MLIKPTRKKLSNLGLRKPSLTLNELGSFEVEHLQLPTLLFQTGYLTIRDYHPQTQHIRLSFPNRALARTATSSRVSLSP